MQLTQHTDFGLRLLLALAKRAGDGAESAEFRPLSVPEFAAEQQLSPNHLAKVAQTLVHAGFAASVRGRSGGLVLAGDPAEITIGAIVRALEPGLRLVDCARCTLRGDCRLSGILAAALEAFLAVLDRHSLADAAAGGVAAFPAWAVPAVPAGTCTNAGG